MSSTNHPPAPPASPRGPEHQVAARAWQAALRLLEAELPPFEYESWIVPLVARAGGDGLLELVAPSDFHRDRVNVRHRKAIARALAEGDRAWRVGLRTGAQEAVEGAGAVGAAGGGAVDGAPDAGDVWEVGADAGGEDGAGGGDFGETEGTFDGGLGDGAAEVGADAGGESGDDCAVGGGVGAGGGLDGAEGVAGDCVVGGGVGAANGVGDCAGVVGGAETGDGDFVVVGGASADGPSSTRGPGPGASAGKSSSTRGPGSGASAGKSSSTRGSGPGASTGKSSSTRGPGSGASAGGLPPSRTVSQRRPGRAAAAGIATGAVAGGAGRAGGVAGGAAAARGADPFAAEASFDNFVVGPPNALAREASLAVAQGNQPGLNPLYLLSANGNGKSHLAKALVKESTERGMKRVCYCSAEAFTGRMTQAIRHNKMPEFRRRFRNDCRLLVIEDVQFFSGKKATQQELIHTVEHLALVGGRVVMTGDRLPREIAGLDARLAGRMASGLVAGIASPTEELRRRILRDMANRGGVALPDDCLERLAEAVVGSVRDLKGALVQVVSSASLLRRRIDLELVEQALHKVAPLKPREPGIDEVLACVCDFYGVSREQLRSPLRAQGILHPRQVAMYLCRHYAHADVAEICRALNRKHPSVRSAIAKIEHHVLELAPLRYQVEELVKRLAVPPRGGGGGGKK